MQRLESRIIGGADNLSAIYWRVRVHRLRERPFVFRRELPDDTVQLQFRRRMTC
jgi:hypothetical protein